MLIQAKLLGRKTKLKKEKSCILKEKKKSFLRLKTIHLMTENKSK